MSPRAIPATVVIGKRRRDQPASAREFALSARWYTLQQDEGVLWTDRGNPLDGVSN